METIEATFRVVTPMFLSGAEQNKAELRLPSLKGALRFWWRALASARHEGDLAAIRDEEATLFGSTDTGQAAVLMRLTKSDPDILDVGRVLRDGRQVVGPGARYLGYGVMEAFSGRKTEAGRLTRPCFSAPFQFSVEFCFQPNRVTEHQKDSVITAIKTMGLFGGLGSKSRKGYGSMVLTDIQIDGEDQTWNVPDSIATYLERLDVLNLSKPEPHSTKALPEYTAFSPHARIVVLQGEVEESTLSLLDRVGQDLVFYRSWGRNGKVLGEESEKNFQPDHDLMKQLDSDVDYPKRVVFGLPHNYGKPTKLHIQPEHWDRRASPLFIHINQRPGSEPLTVLSFLPARFLPEGEKLHVLGNKVELSSDNLWEPIHDFLDRLLDPQQGKEQFLAAVEVNS